MRLLRSLCLLLLSTPLAAQTRLARAAEVRATPEGNVVAELVSGTSWRTGTARAGWTTVTVEGWVTAARFGGRRDTFPESVGGTATLRIREQPSLNGRILGEFRPQAGVRVLERRGTWARVRRDAWVRTTSLAPAPTRPTAPARAATAPVAAQPSAPGTDSTNGGETPDVPAGASRTERRVMLRHSPTGEVVGELQPGVIVEPLDRARGMVRVRIEAWLPDSALVPADTAFGATISAADLKLDPEGLKGRVVRWQVQVVGLQRADALRRDLTLDEPYLLAMGPGEENAILYVAVPAAMLQEARTLEPMTKVLITARVRSGRSAPTGAPVLDLLTLVKR